MRTLKITQEVSPEFLKQKMVSASNLSDYKRWQIMYNVSVYEVDAAYLSDITGYSKAMVYSIVQRFNRSKEQDIAIKQRGGRRRSIMSLEEEKILMKGLEAKALGGQILSANDIRKVIEYKANRPVSDDYIWDLFKRNGWTKHTPRPHHPDKDIEQQEEFKKNSKTIWLPVKMILEHI